MVDASPLIDMIFLFGFKFVTLFFKILISGTKVIFIDFNEIGWI